MKITHEDYDQLSVLTLRGDMVAEHADEFRKASLERIARNTRDFVLDLESMDFIDSKGLEALLWLQETVADKLGQVRLASPCENVQKILEVTRLAPRFDTHDNLDAAIKSLR